MILRDLNRIVDQRNIELWEEIKNHFEIEVYQHEKPYSQSFSQKRHVKIYVNKETDSASFTHELLHLWIERKEIYIGSVLKLLVEENAKLNKVISNDLLNHIGNTCEHIKMLPKFLSLGYKSDQFILDYYINKCTDLELRTIKREYRSMNIYQSKAIDAFIGKFFAVKADNNTIFDYSNCIKNLEKLDPSLFSILDKFWDNWKSYDIEKDDGIYLSYHDVVFEFYEELKNWIQTKTIK
jgi:hypothetical protein